VEMAPNSLSNFTEKPAIPSRSITFIMRNGIVHPVEMKKAMDEETIEAIQSAMAALRSSGDAHGGGPKAAALFDLDGTMARGHMIIDFPSHLLSAGLFTKKDDMAIVKMAADLKKGAVTYRNVAERIPAIFANGVRGQEEQAVSLEAEKFVEWRMEHVFPYAKGLVRLMRESGRPAVAISGSPEDAVRALARRLGMDAAVGTRLEVKKGRFTGKVLRNLILEENKKALFEELMDKLALDASKCFGFGDTEQDVSFLGGVGHPVALNPSPELKTIALSKGWHIFDNDDDVVSEVKGLLGNSDAVQGKVHKSGKG
jgi:HAD superfamily hydrolase (TIGR01490 family)